MAPVLCQSTAADRHTDHHIDDHHNDRVDRAQAGTF
jgi:hypothetical protein